MSWETELLGNLMFESRIPALNPNPNKRIRVKLNVAGVEKRPLENEIEGATKQFIRKSGQFIYGKQNFHKGAFGIIPPELDGYETSADIPSFDIREDCLPEWVYYFFKINNRYIELEKIARGMGSKRIHPEQLADIEIPLPSIDDQRLYISKFKIIENSTDTVNNELSNQLDLLKKLRQQILQDAVQGKLVQQDPNDEPANKLLGRIIADKEKLVREKKIKKEKPLPPIKPEEIPFTIPANWVWCRFSDIALIETNLVDPFKYPNLPHIAPDNIEKGTGKLLDYKTVKEDNIISANHYFFPSQLIYSKVRPRLNKVVKVSFEGLCSADMYPLKSLINPDYLLYCMLSDYFLSEVNRFDNRVKMPKINQNQLSLILFPLPPLPEQERIITKIKSSLEICEVLEQTIQENQKFTKDLLQVALKEALEPKTY